MTHEWDLEGRLEEGGYTELLWRCCTCGTEVAMSYRDSIGERAAYMAFQPRTDQVLGIGARLDCREESARLVMES